MVTRLELAHGQSRRRISAEAERLIRQAWVLADGVEDLFVAEAVAVAASARAAIVGEVDAYLAAYLTVQGAPTAPKGLDPSAYGRQVDPDVQWRRPYTQMRVKLSEGMEFPQAFAFGGHMASTMIATDLQVANVGASRDWMVAEPKVQAYARVLGSGGKSGENCGLCVTASTQRYWKGDLMPIHDHCTCEVKPILTSGHGRDRHHAASGQVIHQNNLDEVYARVHEMDGSTLSRNDLGKVRIKAGELPRPAVMQHAEIGPYLYDASHKAPVLNASA
jgi:hypothetical protein